MKEKEILECIAAVMKDNGFHTELAIDEAGTQPPILRIETRNNGKLRQDVMLELCFVPLKMPTEGMALLQCYATLFTGLREKFARELRHACEYCNDYCALGAFGFFATAGQLYLKHNTVLDTTADAKQMVTFVTENLSLVLAGVSRFIDAFGAIGNGVMTVESAIQQDILPSM